MCSNKQQTNTARKKESTYMFLSGNLINNSIVIVKLVFTKLYLQDATNPELHYSQKCSLLVKDGKKNSSTVQPNFLHVVAFIQKLFTLQTC